MAYGSRGTVLDTTKHMDKQRMIFEIDRHTVTEGDVVEVKWDCTGSEQTTLTLDNGFRATDIPVEPIGTKRFRLNRSKGRTRLTIAVTIAGKTHRKTVAVRVKKIPTVKAETIDHRGRRVGAVGMWWKRVVTKWQDIRAKIRLAMQSMPERKQMALKMLTLIGVALILSAIWPRLYGAVLMVVIVYLMVVLLRR